MEQNKEEKKQPSKCRSCGADIYWVVTRMGKKMPVEASSWDGEIMYKHGQHKSHFDLCPHAQQHRRES